jgi:hypothetical protein
MSPSNEPAVETITDLPPQEVWLALSQTQQQKLCQALVGLCRQMLQTVQSQAAASEVEHA